MTSRAVAILLSANLLAPAASFEDTVKPFVDKTCLGCHNSKLQQGSLDLTKHTSLKDRDVWESVVKKLRASEMPPKGLARPPLAAINKVTNFIETEYDKQDRNAKPDPGRVTARRLNRYEYNNTIRDLTGVAFQPANDFPADDAGYGFDNIGDVLSLSPVLMEKYLTAAETVARLAVVAARPTYRNTRTLLKAESVNMGEFLKTPTLPDGARGPMPTKNALHVRHKFPAQAGYDIKVTMGGIRPGDAPTPVTLAFWIDGELQKTWPVDPKTGKPRNFESRYELTPGEHSLSAAFLNGNDFDRAVNPIGPRDRYLAIDLFEVRGPIDPVAPPLPESHRRLISCGHDLNQHQPDCPRKLISDFARRAFRRTPTDTEVARLVKLMESAQAEGDTFEAAFRVALTATLVSPHFLFRIEHDLNPLDATAEHPITETELATRLSYFLWASTPDDELLNLAEQNQLRAQLKPQLRRMLADPKSASLGENFAGQWLQLRNLAEAKPDPDRFPNFDDDLRQSMRRETELFFETVVKEDLSIIEFLDGRWTWLNERLANHYGIPGIDGPDFRRVALTGPQRSGVLTQASILTVSSYPTRTSPVIRGKWVLENLLNTPPPPPPPNVPNLDEAAVGNKGSLRQQLEKHRANAICASCHSKMDPLGFGLENYDAIGAWRTKDGKFPVEAGGILPSGKSFRTSAELKAILKTDRAAFAQCLTEKLLTYALGRGLDRTDRPAVQSISRRLAASGYRFSALIEGIAESLPFGNRRGEGPRT
ncbi:MAG: DUF1592 domain-containing protein [Bryobacteraceae bacterium]|nr:DUF1592 domain-containing protein [Bryobacteraceae bacterium]